MLGTCIVLEKNFKLYLRVLFLLIVLLWSINCLAQASLRDPEPSEWALLIDKLTSNPGDVKITSELDTYIQNHNLNVIQVRIMSEILFRSESEACLLYTSPSPRDRG